MWSDTIKSADRGRFNDPKVPEMPSEFLAKHLNSAKATP